MSVGEPEVGYGKRWWSTLSALRPVEMARACSAVEQFLKDPDHLSLKLHPLSGDPTKSLYTFRATQEMRVLLAKRGNVHVLLEVGHHDDIYNGAPRLQFTVTLTPASSISWRGSTVTLSDNRTPPMTVQRPPADVTDDDTPRPLDHWTDTALAEAGCTDEDVQASRACRNEYELCRLAALLLELVVEIMELTPNGGRNPGDADQAEEQAADRLRVSLVEHGALAGSTKLLSAAELVAPPAEDWIVFLHPEQWGAVVERYDGPARVGSPLRMDHIASHALDLHPTGSTGRAPSGHDCRHDSISTSSPRPSIIRATTRSCGPHGSRRHVTPYSTSEVTSVA